MGDTAGMDTMADLKKTWSLLLVLGIASLVFGALLIFWPGRTLTVVTSVVGLFMIIAGVIRFLVAVFDAHAHDRWLMAIAGIVGVILGVVVMKYPEATIAVIVLLTAIFWIVGGMVDFFRGMSHRDAPDSGLRIAFGALSAIFGVVVLSWPSMTVFVFAVLTGIYVAFFGVLEIAAALQLKKA